MPIKGRRGEGLIRDADMAAGGVHVEREVIHIRGISLPKIDVMGEVFADGGKGEVEALPTTARESGGLASTGEGLVVSGGIATAVFSEVKEN